MNITDPLETLLVQAVEFLPKLIAGLITFFLSVLAAPPLARWVRRALVRRLKDEEIVCLLGRLTHWSVVIVGTLVALDQVNFDVTGFLAGLGVVGITLGFALQDIARNFVAGILILMRQPFEIGDAVQVGGYTGKVREVTTRDTVIETWDGELAIIANTQVFEDPILNFTRLPQRRRSINIGLGYDQDVGRAMQVFSEAVRDVEGVLDEPEPHVLAEELGDFALTLVVRFWVDQTVSSLLGVQSDVVVAINAAAERAGIALPYPIQTVRLEQAEDT